MGQHMLATGREMLCLPYAGFLFIHSGSLIRSQSVLKIKNIEAIDSVVVVIMYVVTTTSTLNKGFGISWILKVIRRWKLYEMKI